MIDRTTIICGTERHTIRRLKDGAFVADTHHNVDSAVEAFQVAAILGVGTLPTVAGCVSLLAMLRSGMSDVCDANGDVKSTWLNTWDRYWKNPLVVQLSKEYTRERDVTYKHLFNGIKKLMPRSSRLPLHIRVTHDIGAHEDAVVGYYMEDEWKLPVASDWLATCAKEPLHDGKLVLGRTADVVYILANDKKVSDAWYVRKIAA